MPGKSGSKYDKFFADAEFNRWIQNVRRGSPITAEVAIRRLGRACELLNLTPKQMIKQSKGDLKQFQDNLEDLVARLEKESKAPMYISGILKNVKSWLKYNDVTLTRKIKISNSTATPTIENEQIPSQEELAKIYRNSTSRIRLAETLMAFADLRPESIGNYNGSDGLKLSDLPEVKIENNEIILEKIPIMIVVRAILSKTRHKYFTFLCSEGCTYLKEYLEERIRTGEKLTPDSTLIKHERMEATKRSFMLTRKITELIRKAMRKAGIFKRPYVLRAYAETQLIIAESKGKISHPYLQFIAGHKGDIEARYSTNKGRLPPNMIEDIREAYKRCEPFLQTIGGEPTNEEKMRDTFRKQLLLVAGLKQDEIEKIDLASLSDEEFQNMIRQKLLGMMANNGSKQKLISTEEVESYLSRGWEFVATLPNDKAIIKVPF